MQQLQLRYENIANALTKQNEKSDTQYKADVVKAQIDQIRQGSVSPYQAATILLADAKFTKPVKRSGFDYAIRNMLAGGFFNRCTGKVELEKAKAQLEQTFGGPEITKQRLNENRPAPKSSPRSRANH